MELRKILNGIGDLKARGDLEKEIKNITTDSREVKNGDMFIAIKGFETDGHSFIQKAIENGAKTLLIDEDRARDIIPIVPADVTLITTKDTRIAVAICVMIIHQEK